MTSNGVAHKRSLSTDQVEKRKLRPNLECHDPITKWVIMQTASKISRIEITHYDVWLIDNSFTVNNMFINCTIYPFFFVLLCMYFINVVQKIQTQLYQTFD